MHSKREPGRGISPASPLTPPKYIKTFGSSRESPHTSPLIKRSMQEAIEKNFRQQQQQRQQSPRTPGSAQVTNRQSNTPQKAAIEAQKQTQTVSPSPPVISSVPGSMNFSASGRYLYNISDSPGRKCCLSLQFCASVDTDWFFFLNF